jgi:hypothetical protein
VRKVKESTFVGEKKYDISVEDANKQLETLNMGKLKGEKQNNSAGRKRKGQ